MQDLAANVFFKAPGTEAQRKWLQRTHIPLASIAFSPIGAPHAEEGSLAQLLLDDPTSLTASEATLLSVTGLEAQSATPEQFATFCQRFKALEVLRLNLPTDHGGEGLSVLPRSLRLLGAKGAVSIFEARLPNTGFVRVPLTCACTRVCGDQVLL